MSRDRTGDPAPPSESARRGIPGAGKTRHNSRVGRYDATSGEPGQATHPAGEAIERRAPGPQMIAVRAGGIAMSAAPFPPPGADQRDRLVDPEARRWFAATWPEEERADYLQAANAAARRSGYYPKATSDHHATVQLQGLCAVLLRKGFSPELAHQLTQAWNEARIWDPLPWDDVRALCNRAAADELRRRRRGNRHAA